ncbi:autotransporter outer membrane beta-barrel domain-containing protein [Halomonas huangheensis]|uniref:Autotransporter domain-containing protein n=2 Tax=Halomonas huangheensis TaxID=1178482 RepID=W1NAL4_9GAMM|nr:autotransporter outer membrane beta-barrel domain-containing protein [Halomonas huangheensis]ALM54021.1 hypothetical protein AR456_18380 [Halomonas huangheensis]ERL52602.1 hypothetical protein BJB45_08595 [Halomonas huangheensis]
MNHFYRLIWNTSLGCWSAAGENSRRHGKTGRALIGAGSALALSLSGNAWSAELVDFNPHDNDHQVGVITISGGASDILSGTASQFSRGESPAGTSISLGELEANGQVVDGTVGDKRNLSQGAKTTVTVLDPITGSNRVVEVYDSANFTERLAADSRVTTYTDVGDAMYIDARAGAVDSSGGTLTVELGDATARPGASSNKLQINAKQTSLFHADGTGSESSSIIWNSRNQVSFGTILVTPESALEPQQKAIGSTEYTGAFTAFDGSQHTVNSVDDLRGYNDWLVTQLQAGKLDEQGYSQAFSQAYSTTYSNITIDLNQGTGADNEALLSQGTNALIHAVGANASGVISSDGDISATGSGFGNGGSVMLAEGGASIRNEGSLSLTNGARGMSATGDGSTALNSGVMNQFSGIGATIEDGASFSNTGIMNLSSGTGVIVRSTTGEAETTEGASGVNSGIINVYNRGTAASVSGASSFTNEAGAEIYLGRQSLLDVSAPEEVEDVATSLSRGLSSTRGGSVINDGTITLGSMTEGSTGIWVGAINTTDVPGEATNNGIIDINGRAGDAPLMNVGIRAENTRDMQVTNSDSGEVNVNGVNGVGLMALDKGAGATIVSTGEVNVNGAVDPVSGVRNFGAWAEGTNADIQFNGGSVNLVGDGAIGVHARDKGNILVDGGAITFAGGSDQIGYFAYGKGSAIDITAASTTGLDVSTRNSTLFRIEDGATITTAGGELIASGDGSTALQVTGEGSVANLDTLNISVSGQDATALKVEGGASGSMSGNASLTLNDGSVAVVVDDTKYDLTGAAVGSGDSVFTNTGAINVADAQDVTLFRVKNGAELINSGNIDLADGTAVELSGAGSQMKPNASGVAGTITVHDGVAGIHVMDGATLDTSNDITVDGGASGVLIAADAGEVVINSDAHITGLGSGYGNLITSQAAQATTLVDGAVLEMKGSGAAILSESNLNQASHGQVLVSSEVGGKGISLSNADGSVSDGSLSVGDGWDIDVTGNGAGLYANTTGNLTVDTAIDVSGTGNAVLADAAGNVLVDTGAVLRATNADAVLVQGNIDQLINRGQIVSADSSATAVQLGDGDNSFINTADGSVTGVVNLGAGNDTALLAGNSFVDHLAGGAGDDSVTVQGDSSRYTQLDGGAGTNQLVFDHVTQAQATADNVDSFVNFQQINLSNGTVMELQRDLWATAPVNLMAATGTGNTLNIDSTSTLNVSGSQTLSGDLNTNGRVNIGSDGPSWGNTFTIDGNLSGAGEFGMQTDLASEHGDLLDVRGTASGDHTLVIADSGVEPAFGGGELKVVGTTGGDGQFALLGGHVDAGAYRYSLEQRDTDWYLASPVRDLPDPIDPPLVDPVDPTPVDPVDPTPVDPVDPTPVDPVDPTPVDPVDPTPVDPVDPTPVDPVDPTPVVPVDPTPDDYSDGTNMAIGNQTALGTLANAGMDTLVERLGDVRMGKENGGIWVRGMARENNISTDTSRAFDQDIQGLQFGADKAIHREGGSWLLGGMVGQSRSDNSFDGGASSDIDSVDGGLYGTWVGDDGFYYDAVVTMSDYDVDSEHVTNVGDKVNGSYDTYGFGASIETGKRYDYDDGWYVEPQAQLRMFQIQGESYTQDDGLHVENDDITSIQSRFGVLGGRSFQLQNGTPMSVYAKASYITEHDGDSTTTVNGHDFDVELPGSWLEVGAGLNVKVTDSSKIFMDVEYADGDDIESPWGATIGYRFNW